MNACGKFNWIFDVFKLRRSEREILAPASRVACGTESVSRLRSPARQLVMLQSKLIFNAFAMTLLLLIYVASWARVPSPEQLHAEHIVHLSLFHSPFLTLYLSISLSL